MGNKADLKKQSNFKFNTKVAMFIIISIVGIIFFAFASYSIFISTDEQESTNKLGTGCFSTTFTDSNIISINNAIPTSDTDGLATTPYTFTLTNTCTVKVSYKVILSVLNSSFGDEYVQTSIDGTTAKNLATYGANTSDIDSGYTNSYVLSTGTLAQNANVTFNLRLWLKESTTYDQVSASRWQGQVKVINTATN